MSNSRTFPIKNQDEVLLGVDYGEANIGLAFGRNGLVTPGPIISGKNDGVAVREISKYAVENRANKIVFGLPLTDDGKETVQSMKVRKFAKLLRVFMKVPTSFINESNSTKEALETALDYNISQKNRRTLDNIAAAIILKKYYRENAE